MTDIEKVKNLLIKLDLKYKATKDQLNANGIMVLIDFDKEYKEFNTINALDVLNNIENKLAITEKALELACERVKYFEELQDKEMGHFEFFGYDNEYDLQAIIEQYKQQAKEMAKSE